MKNNAVQNEAGFSLIEILVALTIFAVGLLATAGMQITALQSNASAHKMTTINTAASGIMEEILTWSPSDPRLLDEAGNPHTWDFDPTATVNNTLTVSGGGSFIANYVVARNTPLTGVSTITLEVNSSGGIASRGGNRRVLTCMKKTQ